MQENGAVSRGRLHFILVPGFGGFDVLGQLEYYAGTTDVLRKWHTDTGCERHGQRVVLHYFDNLPTAGVCTRATLLRRFLGKRVLRGEIQKGDSVALIGHSTGGLDIRQLLIDLAEVGPEPVGVEGVEDQQSTQPGASIKAGAPSQPTPDMPSGADLLGFIERVVFLSVPQRGTNIANWTRAQRLLRAFVLGATRIGVDLSDVAGFQQLDIALVWLIEALRTAFVSRKLEASLPDVVLALEDVRAEMAGRTSRDAVTAADARAAFAELSLWLSHTYADFLAIDDLACAEAPTLLARLRDSGKRAATEVLSLVSRGVRNEKKSMPGIARATDAERAREQSLWKRHGIDVRSYASVGRRPWPDPPAHPLQVQPLARVLTDALKRLPRSDAVYQLGYSACSAGPFAKAMQECRARLFDDPARVRELESWDNDGVVNTASMLWPNGEDTRLIEADHGDVIGHYGRLRAEPPAAPLGARRFRRPETVTRKYHRYDILSSGSGFNADRFERLWRDIFDFCAGNAATVYEEKRARDGNGTPPALHPPTA